MTQDSIKMRAREDAMTVRCDECGLGIDGVGLDELESYVGYACPRCGAEMLSRNDYEVAVALATFINDDANSLAEKFARMMDDIEPGHRRIGFSDGQHGDTLVELRF